MDERMNQEKTWTDSPLIIAEENGTEGGSNKIISDRNHLNSETNGTGKAPQNGTSTSAIVNQLFCLEDISNDSLTNQSIPEITINDPIPKAPRKRRSNSKDENEPAKIKTGVNNTTCKHESKNFKIVKRRFRCADCGVIACPECYAIGSTSLHRHLHAADNDNNYKIYPCTLCDLYFLSQCSLQAHIRIHMLDSPFVCPDCGCIYSNMYYLTLHLINKCYHVYKVMRFRCSICTCSYKSADAFSDHVRKVHINAVVKCSGCDFLFDTVERFQNHIPEFHNDEQVINEPYICCSLCVSSSMPKSLEEDHIKYHKEHSVSHQFLYICPCGAQHNSMNSFRGHLPFCKRRGVIPAHWNYLQTKMKSQELTMRKRNKGELYCPDSPDSNTCVGCGEELTESEVATCKKCVGKGSEGGGSNKLEISQNSDMVVIQLKDDDSEKGKENNEVLVLEEKSNDSSKILYDHVPNDHLGYLKTHENKNGHFQTETILDEETGMMKSAKVWVEPKEKEKEEEEIKEIRVKKSSAPTTYSDFKKKYKDAFFSCPFCSTLFFKHESSFQKFFLHVECYHTDAGIDVVADKNDVVPQKKPLVVIPSDEDSEDDFPPPKEENNTKIEIFRPRVIHEDDKKSENMGLLPKKKRMTLLKITTPPVKKKKDFFEKKQEEEPKTETKPPVKVLNFETEPKKLNGLPENPDDIVKKESDAEEKPNPNDSSANREEDSEASQSSSRSSRRKTTDETPKKDHEVWDLFYESLKKAENLRLKKPRNLKEPGEDPEKVAVTTDYSSKRVVKKPKRFMLSSGDESEEYSETEKEKEKMNLEKTTTPEKNDEPETKPDSDFVKKQIDQKFVDSLFNFMEKKDKQIDLYKKHSELRLNRPAKDYRMGVLNGIKIRGRPKKFLPFNERSLLKQNQELKSPTGKSKRRGRPRKPSHSLNPPSYYDSEVNFIEKNFESEEKDGTKRKRKLSSKIQFYQKINQMEFSSGQLINNKNSGVHKKLTCAICKCSYPNVTDFRKHVLSHRMDENSFQCMECGECFVVRPSLAKHLHAFHKIKDIDKYIIDNNCSVNENEKEEEPEPLKENQCKVCKDQFDCPGDLNKHFRIHGMAFLKAFKKESAKEEVPKKEELPKKEEMPKKEVVLRKEIVVPKKEVVLSKEWPRKDIVLTRKEEGPRIACKGTGNVGNF